MNVQSLFCLSPMVRSSPSSRWCCAAIALAFTLTVTVRADTELDEDRRGDAGSLPPSALPAVGMGALTAINGRLMEPPVPMNGAGPVFDQEDMYLVQINDPAAFLAQTVIPERGDMFDTRLWLFDACGNGLLANDNSPDDPGTLFSTLLPFSTDGSGAALMKPGAYHIAITATPNEPLSELGPIFLFQDPNEVSGPDGPGGPLPIIAWLGETMPESAYRIELGGVTYLGLQSECPADLDGNGAVSGEDLGAILSTWGMCPQDCTSDLNSDGIVDGGDLGLLLNAWGVCAPPQGTPCGDPFAGSCAEAHGAPGCSDACCCTLVCQVDPHCCDLGWDQPCVDQAAMICP